MLPVPPCNLRVWCGRPFEIECMYLVAASNEIVLRLAVFLVCLMLIMAWEQAAPCRPRMASVPRRWFSNLTISLLNRVLLQALPMVALSTWAGAHVVGVFNVFDAPGWVVILVCVMALDLVVYLQHRLFHQIPWLWRLHRMHHADLDFDVTTGVRFHPFEAVVSSFIKAVAVLVLGAPVMHTM